MDPLWLPQFWALLIALALFVYMVRDGYDLGVGILFGFTRDGALRETLVRAISPFWDGNEVWLVLVGAGLFAAFPTVYAIVLPAFYLPLTAMLIALIFRGVFFEFRDHAGQSRLWDRGFFLGSLAASFIQGAALGGLIQGIAVADGRYAGGAFDWLTPFTLTCGAGLTLGYALLGAAWLVLRTAGEAREKAYRLLAGLLAAFVTLFLIAAFWTAAVHPRVASRWLESPWLLLTPALGAAAILGLWAGVRSRRDTVPYAMAALLFLALFLAAAGSFWPYLVPFAVTIDAAAAPVETLRFLFYGAGIPVFPLVLVYSGVVLWTLRGKV